MTRDVIAELKALRLHGMAATLGRSDRAATTAISTARAGSIEQMLRAETTDRATRSVSHQMNAAKFPAHRDLAGFDFEVSPVDRKLVLQLAETAFTEAAHNVVLVGGPGSGKSHLGDRHRRVRHHPARQAGALLLDGGLGQRAGAGEGAGQGRTHRRQRAAHGRGHPRRAGLLALQPGRRSAAVPPAQPSSTSTPASSSRPTWTSPNGPACSWTRR